MSEAERKKRLNYKERRKKLIFAQGVALAIVALLILMSVFTYNQLNKEYYITYKESSGVDYRVKIPKDAPFYNEHLEDYKEYADENGDLWLPPEYAYPTMAVSVIKANINYGLNMSTRDVNYKYTYRIFATAQVVDNKTKNEFQMPVYVIEDITSPVTQSSNNNLNINRPVEINYHDYNNLVEDFEKKLGITSATETLIITMEVNVIGSSESFENDSNNRHTISINIPLAENSFDVNYSTSVSTGDSKVLARKDVGNQNFYKDLAIVLGTLELALLIIFTAYVYLTKNHDVNYSIKVQKLVNNYRSFIQQVTNGFDATGYQILEITTFKEMLAIRDTIQSPVLMSENTDQTRTQFFIPTNTKILYLFEIKVENYDELYGKHPDWTDDSLVNKEYIAAEPEIPTITVDPVVTAEENTNEDMFAKLFQEIERLRADMEASREPAVVPQPEPQPAPQLEPQPTPQSVPQSVPQIIQPPGVSGPMKFGNFTAGGNVTINYSEKSDDTTLVDVVKIITDSFKEQFYSKNVEKAAPSATQCETNTSESVAKRESPIVQNVSIITNNAPQNAPVNASVTPDNVSVNQESEPTPNTVANNSRVEESFENVVEAVSEEPVTEATSLDVVTEEITEQIVESDKESADEVIPEEPSTASDAEVDAEADTVAEATVSIANEEPIVEIAETAAEEIAEAADDTAPAPEEHAHIDLDHVLNDLEFDEAHGYFINEDGTPLNIQCKRSFTANVIQSDPETVKYFYSELKNYALSFKGVKARMSWRYEAFKKGRDQLLRIKIRGKSICLYCALDPEQFDKSKYFQEAIDAKMFDCVPMLVKVKSPRGLKRAFELIDATMEKFGIQKNPKAQRIDYVLEHPFENTKSLVEKGLIRILDSEYIIKEHSGYDTQNADAGAAVTDTLLDSDDEFATSGTPIEEALTEYIEEIADSANADEAEQTLSVDILEFDESGEIIIPEEKQLSIHCKRSFTANIMQSDPTKAKAFYNELKNYILSFKGVKPRMAWRYESFKRGRDQLFRIRLKGKSLCLYCALDPTKVDESRYFHDTINAKDYTDVPTMVKIKTPRGLSRAKELVDTVMQSFGIIPNPKAKEVDYMEVYPFQKTAQLIEQGYVKVLSDSYKIKEPKAPKIKKATAKK